MANKTETIEINKKELDSHGLCSFSLSTTIITNKTDWNPPALSLSLSLFSASNAMAADKVSYFVSFSLVFQARSCLYFIWLKDPVFIVFHI